MLMFGMWGYGAVAVPLFKVEGLSSYFCCTTMQVKNYSYFMSSR